MAARTLFALALACASLMSNAQFDEVPEDPRDDFDEANDNQMGSSSTNNDPSPQAQTEQEEQGPKSDSQQLGPQPQLLQEPGAVPHNYYDEPEEVRAAPAPATSPEKAHALQAKEAAAAAKQAATVANKVATHSVKVKHHAKAALKHALGALHDARVESAKLNKGQRESLKKAEARLREATQTAEHGKIKQVKAARDLQKERMQDNLNKRSRMSEREQMQQEIEELRRQLKDKNIADGDIDKSLSDLEGDLKSSKGPVDDESKAELERVRQVVDSLDAVATTTVAPSRAHKVKPARIDDEAVVPVQEKGFDIDTQMPYGDLEPFGREDTAQELTEASIKESDEMVDQLERAEVAEEKRAVFRALTRLRGAAITSFDGVARSQTGNIDEYSKVHQWRQNHPLHHLADEESDVSKWAFPDNAD